MSEQEEVYGLVCSFGVGVCMYRHARTRTQEHPSWNNDRSRERSKKTFASNVAWPAHTVSFVVAISIEVIRAASWNFRRKNRKRNNNLGDLI